MANRRGSEFEPVFGSKPVDASLAPRLRDRRVNAANVASTSDLAADAEAHGTLGHPAPPLPRPSTISAEPVVPESTESRRPPGHGPEIPSEILEAQARSAEAKAEPVASDNAGSPQRVGTRWFRVRRRILTTFAALVALGLLYFLVSLAQVWSTGRSDDSGPADAIVVMGAAQYDGRPSPQLAARLDHVLKIWPEGVAPLVVVTGGNLPGDRFTEAEASAGYLIERGIPADAIQMENAGTTSHESLVSVSALLAAQDLNDVVIVTDPYHALRSRLIAEEVGLDAEVSSTDTSVVTGFDSFSRHVQEAGGVAIGRVISFERLADLTD